VGSSVKLLLLNVLPLCFQNFLRCQNNKTNYNLVCETLQFLDIMCGSTTGGLGLLGLYINESNVHLITQTLETLTEYCQGPCQENQVDRASQGGVEAARLPENMDAQRVCVCVLQTCIVTNDSNGIDIITALILNDISPLCRYRMDMVLQLKVRRPHGASCVRAAFSPLTTRGRLLWLHSSLCFMC